MPHFRYIKTLLIVFFALLFTCSFSEKKGEPPKNVLLIVEGIKIYQKEVELRQKLNKMQAGMDSSYKIALYQMVKSAYLQAICKKYQFPLTDKVLGHELIRINKSTHRPQIIQQLKQLAGDSVAYARVYVLPDFAERWAYSNFLWNYKIHQKIGANAQLFLSKIIDKKITMQNLSKNYSLRHQKLLVSKDKGFQLTTIDTSNTTSNKNKLIDLTAQADESTRKQVQQQMVNSNQLIVNQLIDYVLKSLKPNTFHSKPVEMKDSFWFVRLISKVKNVYQIETLEIPKQSYSEFIGIEFKTIKPEIIDTTAWDKIALFF